MLEYVSEAQGHDMLCQVMQVPAQIGLMPYYDMSIILHHRRLPLYTM